MNSRRNKSLLLHYFVFLCFLFPFFYTGCEKEVENENKSEIISIDTLGASDRIDYKYAITDTIASVLTDKVKQNETSTDTSSRSNNENSTSHILVDKYPILGIILIPSSDSYSGLATVIDTIQYFPFFSTFLSFLFLILSLAVKYMDSSSKRVIIMLNICALVTLFVSKYLSYNCENLWGYWTCLVMIGILTIYDIMWTRTDQLN